MAEKAYEWEYFPGDDGEPFTDKDGNEVLGWHDRIAGQDEIALCAAFEAYEGRPLVLRPILTRWASDIECRINGWEEGSFTRCTERAKHPMPMWQIEALAPGEERGKGTAMALARREFEDKDGEDDWPESGTFSRRSEPIRAIRWTGDNIADVQAFMDPTAPRYMAAFSNADDLIGMPDGVAMKGDWILGRLDGTDLWHLDAEEFHRRYQPIPAPKGATE
jgi:hypothetical protein